MKQTPPLGYRLLLLLLLPALLVYTVWRGIKDKSYRYLLQRLGFAYPELDSPLWLHCASVGELNTALPLIVRLQQHCPNTSLLLSSNTTSSAAVLKKQALPGVTHCYLPLDMPWMIASMISATNPRATIILETELWPNLFCAVRHRNIPLIIVNARLSARTLRAKKWLQSAYCGCLVNTTTILARSKIDAGRYRQLGARRNQIQVIGNLKFAPPLTGKRDTHNLIGRDYVLAASTHHDEERQLVNAWIQCESKVLLVIAPRHPHRGRSITRQLRAMGMAVARRSNGEVITQHTRVYLADTLGELHHLIAYARWVFIGGSLIPHGGQNLLEPARAGKAVLCGPYMDNFSDETAAIVAAGGAIQLKAGETLSKEMAYLINHPHVCKALGNAAADVCRRQQTIAVNYADTISRVLKQS